MQHSFLAWFMPHFDRFKETNDDDPIDPNCDLSLQHVYSLWAVEMVPVGLLHLTSTLSSVLFFLHFVSLLYVTNMQPKPDPHWEQTAICRLRCRAAACRMVILRRFLCSRPSLVVPPYRYLVRRGGGRERNQASFQRGRMKPRLIKQNERALAVLHWEFSIPLVMKY